jgi:hypothetical protein
MILKCDCNNTSADALYGKGRRPHTKLVTVENRPGDRPRKPQPEPQHEWCCSCCSWVRTKARGLKDGRKTQ